MMNSGQMRRHILLLVLFIVFAVISHFYDPWGEGAAYFATHMSDHQELTDGFLNNTVFTVVFYGIADWIQILEYGAYKMAVIAESLPSGWELAGYGMIGMPILFFVFEQIALSKLDGYYEETLFYDHIIEKTLDFYFVENIVSYIVCVVANILNTEMGEGIKWLCVNHEYIAAFFSCIFILFGLYMMLCMMPIYVMYAILLFIPILILGAIPALNNMLGAILLIILELIMIFFVWRNYVADLALKATRWLVLLPIRKIQERLS